MHSVPDAYAQRTHKGKEVNFLNNFYKTPIIANFLKIVTNTNKWSQKLHKKFYFAQTSKKLSLK
jgi:hypothetical protein